LICIDFRKLNDATASASWPIANKQQMIIRIGAHRQNQPWHRRKAMEIAVAKFSQNQPKSVSA
jgi:hypothetical protein